MALSRADALESNLQESSRSSTLPKQHYTRGGVVPGVQGIYAADAANAVFEASTLWPEGRAGSEGVSDDDTLEVSLALVAHELRSPLLAARMSVDALLDDDVVASGERVRLQRVVDELASLAELVHPLLRWAATDEMPNMRPTDLVELVRHALSQIGEADADRRCVVVAPARVVVSASDVHLQAAIANLVRNALAVSPLDAEIVVRIQVESGVVVLSVEDSGPGVSSADSETIFDIFTRGGPIGSSRRGRGLGLFIARRVVEAHGGRIWLEPRSGRSGAIFRIELPSANARPRQLAPSAAVMGAPRALRSG
jgi:signal transduction histidine kinase